MLLALKKLFNGGLLQDIINNFDPYQINEMTRLELTKEKNKKETKNAIMGKD
jgi:hypothetical protein